MTLWDQAQNFCIALNRCYSVHVHSWQNIKGVTLTSGSQPFMLFDSLLGTFQHQWSLLSNKFSALRKRRKILFIQSMFCYFIKAVNNHKCVLNLWLLVNIPWPPWWSNDYQLRNLALYFDVRYLHS